MPTRVGDAGRELGREAGRELQLPKLAPARAGDDGLELPRESLEFRIWNLGFRV